MSDNDDITTGVERGERAEEQHHGKRWLVERHRGGEIVTLAWRYTGEQRGTFRHLGRADALALADALRDAARDGD